VCKLQNSDKLKKSNQVQLTPWGAKHLQIKVKPFLQFAWKAGASVIGGKANRRISHASSHACLTPARCFLLPYVLRFREYANFELGKLL
jgi:hypothetical protein